MKTYKITSVYTVTKTTTTTFKTDLDPDSDEFQTAYIAAERAAVSAANPAVDYDNDIEFFESSFEESN